MPGALDGVRVLDLAQGVAGPYATMLLAEQGAEVIKLAPRTRDRLHGSAAYHVLNRSKRLLLAERDAPLAGTDVAGLVRDADVIVVDLPEPEAVSRGLDYDSLSRECPALIYLALPPYGSRGPLAADDADESLVAAYGGLSGGQWSGSDQPVELVIPLAGYGAALLGAGAAAAALYERARSGLGQRVEVSWLAGALSMQTGSLLRGQGVERLAGTAMDPLGPVPVYRLYQAGDGQYLFIAAGTPRFFQRLCLLLDHPEWISDPRWSAAPWGIVDPDDRRALVEEIAPLIAARPRDEWLRLLTEADIPNARVATREEFIDDAQVAALGMRIELDDPEVGWTVQFNTPVVLHGTPTPGPSPRRTARSWTSERTVDAGQPRARHPAPRTPHGPLAGIRVLDLSGFIAGSYCPMTLADFGADVIKVESLDGDAFRSFGFGFLGWNRGKRGLSVDTRLPEGQAIVHDLVRGADVVVENFRPGAARRLGLDYETLNAINSRLIYSTVTAFGEIGPDAGAPGFDPLLQARSGAMAAQGGMERGHPPVYFTAAICDYAAALLSVYGICAALAARERTGLGQRVESSLVHSALAVQAGDFIWYDGRPPGSQGAPARIGASATDRFYLVADGWLKLGLQDSEQWQRLVDASGAGELSHTSGEEATHSPLDGQLATALESIFATRPLDEWLPLLKAAEIPVAPVVRPSDLFGDAQVLANDLIADHMHAHWGPIRQTGVLAKFARTPGVVERAAPLLGQHSREVLREIGYDEARIDMLLRDSVITEP